MKELPDSVSLFNSTPLFDENSLPDPLKREHRTNRGVWGLIKVESGEVDYIISGDGTYRLNKDDPGVIEPEHPHHLRITGSVSLRIEFYR